MMNINEAIVSISSFDYGRKGVRKGSVLEEYRADSCVDSIESDGYGDTWFEILVGEDTLMVMEMNLFFVSKQHLDFFRFPNRTYGSILIRFEQYHLWHCSPTL